MTAGRGAGNMGISKKTASFAVTTLCAIMLAAWANPALATPTATKPIRVSVAPGSAAVGATTTFVLTITNGSSNQQIGSMDIATPAVPNSVTASQGTLTWAGGSLIQIRSAGLAPGASMNVTTPITVPCSAAAGNFSWSVRAKQSNDFNGPPGNNFSPFPATTSASITGSCHLAFSAQPADTELGSVTTSVAGNPSGAAVAVQLLDGNNNLITSPAATISLGFGANPSGAGLTGGSASTSAGTATFPNLKIDTIGEGYTLVASSTGATSATSDSFNVVNAYCDPNTTCTTSGSDGGGTTTNVSSPVGDDGGYIVLSFGAPDFQCADPTSSDGVYHGVTSAADFNVVGGSDYKTVTLTVGKGLVRLSPNNGSSFYQVCYLGGAFTDRFGVAHAAGSSGLLPDCDNTKPPGNIPCVQSRNKDKSGQVVLTFFAPTGDPKVFG
jgi:hypothetical protein